MRLSTLVSRFGETKTGGVTTGQFVSQLLGCIQIAALAVRPAPSGGKSDGPSPRSSGEGPALAIQPSPKGQVECDLVSRFSETKTSGVITGQIGTATRL